MKGHSRTGQGLIEYSMIMSLLAVVVIAVLAILGPAVGNIFSNMVTTLDPKTGLNPGEPRQEIQILGVSAQRLGADHANDVLVTVNVSGPTSVTVTDSQSGQSLTTRCSASCQGVLVSVGHQASTVTVSAAGGASASAVYGPKP